MILFAIAATAIAMQQSPTLAPPSIFANGTFEIRAEPDLAMVRVGVTAQAKTARQAQEEANRKATRFIEAGKSLLGASGTIETGRISLSPVFSDRPPRPNEPYVQEIVGYRADNTLVARISDFTKVGPLIDTAVGAGLNNIESVSFSLKDDTEVRLRALREAVRQSRRKADAMAEGAGVEIVGVYEIQEGGARVMPYEMGRAAMAADMATPVIPGAVEVRADVTVRYLIKGRTSMA